jgi:hypothetical protein
MENPSIVNEIFQTLGREAVLDSGLRIPQFPETAAEGACRFEGACL